MSRRDQHPRTDGPALAVGYIRVSTQEQALSGLGLEAQRAAIAQECERRGWQLVHVYEDEGLSGRDMRRPALQSALVSLASGDASVLVASRLDRVARSVVGFAQLMERSEREGWGIAVLDVSVDTSTPSGALMANVVSAFAEYERRLIGARTKAALAVRKAEGVRLGRPRTVPQEVRSRIADMRAQGCSLRAIADVLTNEAVPTGQGGARWHPSTVGVVLKQV